MLNARSSICKIMSVFKALYFKDWPYYLRLNIRNATRMLKSSSQVML